METKVRAGPLARLFGHQIRSTRIALDVPLAEVAARVGLTPSYIARVERGRANPTIGAVESLFDALGIEVDWQLRGPVFIGDARRGDVVHARCLSYAQRRLEAAGWHVAREVEVVHGRHHAWIDLLAFHPATRTLLIVECKTRAEDAGAIERQVTWYERVAMEQARALGWEAVRTMTWLLVLASDEAETDLARHREAFATSFPRRAREMALDLGGVAGGPVGRGLALIDPGSRRRDWLIRSRLDGRRSPAPYASYSAAVPTPRPRAR